MSKIKAGSTDSTNLEHVSDTSGILELASETGVVNFTGGGLILPSGTTAQRPASATVGSLRINSTTGYLEIFYNSAWNSLTNLLNVSPTWTTASGTVATINDAYGTYTNIATLQATDADAGQTLTYAVSSGSLPTGTSLNASTGIISGDPNNVETQTTYTFDVTATDNIGGSAARTFSIIVNPAKDGASANRAATSAKAIKTLTGTTTDGSYWIKPPNCPEAFQVHCYMSIEGGGWMLVLAVADNEFGPVSSGGFLAGNWAGWAYNTKTQIDALGYNYATQNGTNTFTPIFAYSPFNDVMVISRRSGQTSKRLGWRHTNQITTMYSVTGGTNAQTVGNTILFGEPRNWLTTDMDVRPDTTTAGLGNNRKYGFKINADTWGATNSGYGGGLTGGNNFTLGWSNSMIGYGRDNQEGNYSGGGFGIWHYGWEANRYNSLGHHYWGWGSARYSGAWTSDTSNPWYGHAVYVREL